MLELDKKDIVLENKRIEILEILSGLTYKQAERILLDSLNNIKESAIIN
jgi:hypothetical protein